MLGRAFYNNIYLKAPQAQWFKFKIHNSSKNGQRPVKILRYCDSKLDLPALLPLHLI